MSGLPKPIKRPRKLGPCAVAVIDLLQELGVTNPQFFKTHHARVAFVHRGEHHTFHFPCTPRSGTEAAKRVRSKLARQIGAHTNG